MAQRFTIQTPLVAVTVCDPPEMVAVTSFTECLLGDASYTSKQASAPEQQLWLH